MNGHDYICQNAACPENGIKKPSFSPIIGDVICGMCGELCIDNGLTTETFGVTIPPPTPLFIPPPGP